MWNSQCKIEINDVKKVNSTIIHFATLRDGILKVGDKLNQKINLHRRDLITINHSATH